MTKEEFLQRIESDEEYIKELDKKLMEEVNEYLENDNIEEDFKIDDLIKLCKFYGVSADYLIHDEYESDEDLPKVKEKSNLVYMQKVHMLKYYGRMTVISAILTLAMLIIYFPTKMPVFLGIAAGQALFSVVFCILYYVARFNLANYVAEQQ